MKQLKTSALLKLHNSLWLDLKPPHRYQSVQREVHGCPIDIAYGKVIEQKESGGIRLLPIPLQLQYPALVQTTLDLLEKDGWSIEVESLPRSTLHTATFIHQDAGVKFTTIAMPSDDAILSGALIAKKIKEIPDELVREYFEADRPNVGAAQG